MAVTISGSGTIDVGGTSTSQGTVRLYEDTDNGTNYVELVAPASVASNVTLTMPTTTGTVATVAGSDTQVIFNDGGSAYGGDSGLTYNKTTDTLTTSVVVHGAGTASAPSITTTGDTNTGVFFPAADTVGVTTGGSERMRIDSSGRVGIGVTPSSSSGFSQRLQIKQADGIYSGLQIQKSDDDSILGVGYWTTPAAFSFAATYTSTGSYLPISFVTSSTEWMRIGSGGEVYFPGVGTTASAANAYLNNGATPANQLLRSTSSLRYKTDVETLDHAKADAVLNLRPVWYRSKAEADRKDWSWYGLIAEEVAQVEPRLVHWSYPEDQFETIETQTEIEKTREVEVTPAVLDDEGNVVEPAVTETETYTETETKSERKLKADAQLAPDGVQYDRLTVMLLDIVKRQNQRIEQLEAKVAALEAQ
jgi:hypothetical protein